jgi:O-antigen/teichoic acid export membrane protein
LAGIVAPDIHRCATGLTDARDAWDAIPRELPLSPSLGSGATEPGEQAERHDVAHAARSGAIQFLTIAAQALLTVTHVLFARLFGRAVFGSYQASLAILEMITRAGTAGADKGMLRYIAGFRARGEQDLVRSALGTGLRLCLMVAGTLAAILMVFAAPLARVAHEPAMTTALRLMAPAAVFTGCLWVLVQASLAAKETTPNFIVRGLGEPLLLLTTGLLAALVGRSLGHLAVAHVAAAAATLGLAIVVVGRVFGAGELRRALGAPWLPGFARFSIPLGVGELMNAILQRADIVLLTIIVGAGPAAVYAASEFVTRVIANARYVFDSVAAPVFSEALHLGQRDRLRQNLVLMTRWVATAALPIATTVVVLRRDLLSLYGPGFQEGATTLSVLAVVHLLNATFGLLGWILVVGGRSHVILMNNVLVAVVNVALGLTLIPRWGLLGAALAALGSVTLLQVLVLIEVRVVHGVHPFDRTVFKPFFAASVALGVEVATGGHLDRPGVRIPVVILAGFASYLGILVALRLAPEERRLIRGLRDRMRGRFARRS